MQVQDLMSRDVVVINAWDSVGAAAKRMAELDVGALPVSDEDRLVGMITDRDMVVRGLAQGKGVNARVKEVMTPGVKYVSWIRRSKRSPRTWRTSRCAACRCWTMTSAWSASCRWATWSPAAIRNASSKPWAAFHGRQAMYCSNPR